MPSNIHNIPVLSAQQIRDWDKYTIEHEPIASIKLMERAAVACSDQIVKLYGHTKIFYIFCGIGNNGGDGLAIARLLNAKHIETIVYVCGDVLNASLDFIQNYNRIKSLNVMIHNFNEQLNDEHFKKEGVIIDALFGTGLNRAVDGVFKLCIDTINSLNFPIVSIDIPSGLLTDESTPIQNSIVKAKHTLTFQCLKLCFLLPDCADFIGTWQVIDIALHNDYLTHLACNKWFVTDTCIKESIRSKSKFSHKGNNGHALLIAGSYSKYGASILAARAALKSGLGLLTVHIPSSGIESLHTACPEAMLSVDEQHEFSSELPNVEKFNAVGIGPAIGVNDLTKHLLKQIFAHQIPKVIDADAITLAAYDLTLKSQLPKEAVLTPHVKEFERLFGACKNAFERHQKQLECSKKYQLYIVLKGANSCLSCPDGSAYFNSTGNPGMAKGGSGDVLTGIIVSLLAQSYSPKDAAVIGMFVHGLAGDLAALEKGEISMLPSDLIEHLPNAFVQITKQSN